jgi:Cof subfamily protein (haloacid dehalogenase superfamily)
VLVTGRPPRSMRPIAKDAGVTGLAVCSNGAIIYDLADDAVVDRWPLGPDIVAQLVTDLRQAIPGIVFALEYGLHSGREHAYPNPPREIPQQEVLLDDIFVLARQSAVKLIAHHPEIPAEDLLEVAQNTAGALALATYSGVGFIEISAPGVHKAWALEKLCERLGVRAEEVVAFGDMPNDLPMLAWAGRGIAVANAHPAVLQQADEITLSNVEDGVAVVLEQLLDHRDTSSPQGTA